MVTYDDDNKGSEVSSQRGEKRCFDLFATLLSAFGNDETRARRGKEVQERNMQMIETIITAATNTFLLGHKRKIDDRETKNQENTSSRSLVEYKRRRVVGSESDDEPIRAEPIRQIKPPVRERKGPVKQKEPVRREPVVTPGWVVDLMREKEGVEAKMIFEKVMTKTDLTPNQGRLLMPFNQMSDKDFLTEAELKILEEHHKDKKNVKKKGVVDDFTTEKKKGVDVILLKRNGNKKWNLNMRIWEMRTSFNYALCTGWNKVVEDNKLQQNQTITLWSFHSLDGTLYFAFDPPTQDESMSLALVPFTHAASSSSMSPGVAISEDPFMCEEINKSLLPYWVPRRSRTHRVCVQIITNDDSSNQFEGLDLNRTPPPEDTEEMDLDLEAVQETHTRSSSSQESLTETTMVDLEGSSSGCNQRFMGKQLCFM